MADLRLNRPPRRNRRKRTTLPRAVERLMLLDAVLADSERTWLATERDKLAHLTLAHHVCARVNRG